MEWINVNDYLPNVGDLCLIYGYLHVGRKENSSIEPSICGSMVTYHGLRDGIAWFGGWKVDEENTCVTHYIVYSPPKNK